LNFPSLYVEKDGTARVGLQSQMKMIVDYGHNEFLVPPLISGDQSWVLA